ncbi:MAG: DUF3618 domain-containing protein [Umezawaea sp.]
MGTSPDRIRHEIDQTRAELVADANRIVDHTSPRRIVQRRTRGVRRGLTTIRERVMGTVPQAASHATTTVQDRAHDTAHAVQEQARTAANTVADTAEQSAHAIQRAPQQVKQQAQGNPLAAGVVAFGAGLLAASLLPKTEAEQDAVQQIGDRVSDYVEPVKEALADSGQRLKEQIGDTVKEAADEVKQTAGGAAQTTAEHAKEASSDVAGHARASN